MEKARLGFLRSRFTDIFLSSSLFLYEQRLPFRPRP